MQILILYLYKREALEFPMVAEEHIMKDEGFVMLHSLLLAPAVPLKDALTTDKRGCACGTENLLTSP